MDDELNQNPPTSSTHRLALPAGTMLGKYQLDGVLGSGGFGITYLAHDSALHRKVAIKALTPEWAADPDRYRRFRWEAQVLAKLNHPNIVTIYAIEEEEGSHFLIMELVEGKTLDQLIPSVGMSPEEVFRVTQRDVF